MDDSDFTKRYKRLDDMWKHILGVPRHYIETWVLDMPNSTPTTLYFNFDKYLKTKIEKEELNIVTIRQILESWKEDPPYEMLDKLFQEKEDFF